MSSSYADSFDDAVGQFLKGFDHCKEAKAHLGGHRLAEAQNALKQYDKLLAEASALNADILKTSKRGMDGNLKFCQRVARDVEVEVGMPTMDKALAECDAAQQSLKENQPEQAKLHHQQFRILKDSALQHAPSLADIFTVKNQISRCDRIESKIGAHSQKQKALQLSIETAQEESAAYLASCRKTLENLQRDNVDNPVLRDANQGLHSALSHKKNAQDETLANQAFKDKPANPARQKVETSLREGDQCSIQLNAAIARKSDELKAINSKFARYNNQLDSAAASCRKAQKSTDAEPTDAAYSSAKFDYETALNARNSVRDALSKDSAYRSYDGWDSVASIDQHMQNLNKCLGDTKTRIGTLFASLSQSEIPVKAVVATLALAPSGNAAADNNSGADHAISSGSPARKIDGTLRILGLPPEFALFYVPDGTLPRAPEIIIEKTGFDALFYVASSNETLSLKNKDNSTHRISVANEISNFSENLVRLQPRQNKPARVNWPQNTIVNMRSDHGMLNTSYIANIVSANYMRIDFNGNEPIYFRFSNDSLANTAYLLMPDADPLSFTLNKGETKNLPITRNGVPVGSLKINGI